ncbi:hypothetical protein Fuma_01217 [Fuerstiella marisgermanici]|uniref:Uncharacterized protein n=1 Tax=Fuerstiella marisgermanici TaxID=1891926 RepID=A0A1P8WC36_9PLAN|nr:hypothetical protein Fuma_01217 [Fuerstiella marisgermanici]
MPGFWHIEFSPCSPADFWYSARRKRNGSLLNRGYDCVCICDCD